MISHPTLPGVFYDEPGDTNYLSPSITGVDYTLATSYVVVSFPGAIEPSFGAALNDQYGSSVNTIWLPNTTGLGANAFVGLGSGVTRTITVHGGSGSDKFYVIVPDSGVTITNVFHGNGSTGVVAGTVDDQVLFSTIGAGRNVSLTAGVFAFTGSWTVNTPTYTFEFEITPGNWITSTAGATQTSYTGIEALEGTSLNDVLVSHKGDSLDHALSGDATANRTVGGNDLLYGAGWDFIGSSMVYDANYVAPANSVRSGRPADNFIPGLGADTIYFGANTNILGRVLN